jgi:DNA replication protein DnaC
MLNQPTIEKLHLLRLGAMASAFKDQQRDGKLAQLSFDERFAMLVDAELRIASASIEEVDASAARGIDKAMLRQLSSCAWVDQNLNTLITGAAGVGKRYLPCALGRAACRRGLRVLYRRMPRLFDELTLAKADGTYAKLLRKLARAQLLILDDLGLGSPADAQRHDRREVLEDRYGSRATVVTRQLPRESWHEWIGDPTVADAILDRLVHNACKIDLTGPSAERAKPELLTQLDASRRFAPRTLRECPHGGDTAVHVTRYT